MWKVVEHTMNREEPRGVGLRNHINKAAFWSRRDKGGLVSRRPAYAGTYSSSSHKNAQRTVVFYKCTIYAGAKSSTEVSSLGHNHSLESDEVIDVPVFGHDHTIDLIAWK